MTCELPALRPVRTLCVLLVLVLSGRAGPLRAQSIQTVAGGGSLDGSAATAVGLYGPQGLAFDAAGNLYIAQDAANQVVRVDRVTGAITTIAGNGGRGFSGDGVPATSALLNRPRELLFDAAGNLYIADNENNRVRRVDAVTGIITTVAGGGAPADGIGDGGPATEAALREPWGLAIADGKLLISDSAYNGHRIRQVVLTEGRSDTGVISTFAGTGVEGFLDNVPATSALINRPLGITVDSAGNIFFADLGNRRIRRIDAATRTVTTYAGGGSPADGVGDGLPATQAALISPVTVAFDPAGNLHIAEAEGRVRRIDRQSTVISTVPTGSLYLPYGLAFDREGNLYVTNTDQSLVLRRTPAGEQTVYAGGGPFTGDGRAAVASVLRGPQGIAIDAAGNLFIADTSNARIRRVDAATGRISTVAGSGGVYAEGQEGIPAIEASIGFVLDVAVDSAGNLYTVDPHNRKIWKVNTAGTISTLAGGGSPPDGLGDGGPATGASIEPQGVSVDAAGNVYIADGYGHNRIRKVDTSGNIQTIAGSGIGDDSAGYSGDNGQATSAKLNTPLRAVVDFQGNVFISDFGNQVIRKIDPSGVITTYAGIPNGGENLIDDVPALETNMQPGLITVDPAGNLFLADIGFHRIRRIDAQTRIISTVAGSATFYLDGDYAGDEGPARSAKLNFGYSTGGVAVRPNGDVYIADTINNRIRAVYACRTVSAPTLAAPSNNSTDVATGPTLTWSEVPGAYRYDLYIDTTGSPALVAPDLTTTSYSPSNLMPGTRYFWRVVAKGDPFCEPAASNSSSVISFTTSRGCGAPTAFNLSAPTDGATVSATSVMLTWQAAVGAGTYDVFLGSATSAPSLFQPGVATTSLSVSGLARGTTYSWFVMAHAACDPTVTISAPVRSFVVSGACPTPGSFNLIAPQAGETNVSVTPALSWSVSADASSYDVYFGTTPNPPLLSSNLTTTTLSVPQLENATTYYWRIVAKVGCDASRNLSSPVSSFTTRGDCVAPAQPVITFIPDAAPLGQSYAMTWRGAVSLDAQGTYLAERSLSPAFTSIVDSQLTTSTTASFVASALGTFYHRVRAIPECDPNRPGPNSDSASIAIQPPPPNVVFTVQPRARIIALGERLEDRPEFFTLENIGEAAVQIIVGKAEIASVPFFTISDPAGGDPSLVTLEPRTPKRFEIRFSGPSRDVAGAYEGVIFLAATGQPLAVTPYAFVTLKVGAAEAAEPSFEIAGRKTEYLFFPGVADDSNRPPVSVDIRNSGSTPMDLAAEIGPEVWLQPESGWSDTPIPPNAVRTVRLFTRRSRAPNGSALPRFTYFTIRTISGKSARLLVQDNDAIAVASGRAAVLDATAHSYVLPEVTSGTSRRGNPESTVVQLSNIGGDPVQAELIFTPTGIDGFDRQLVKRATVIIPPNDLITLRDPLVQVFGLSPTSGQIEVRIAPEKYGLVSVTSWVAASLPAGGAARYDVATLSRGEGASIGRDSLIAGVRADARMTADLTLVETTGVEAVSVRVVMIDRSGSRLGNLLVEVPRYGRKKIANIAAALGAATVSGGTIELKVQSGGGSVAGLVLERSLASDSGTTLSGKGTEGTVVNKVFLAFDRSGQASAVSIVSVVPLVVNGPLAGSTAVQYQTAAGFTAPASGPASFSVSFVDTSGTSTEKGLTVAAGTTTEFQNILEQFFVLSGSRQGSLFVTHPPGARFQVMLNGTAAGGDLSTVAAVPEIPTLSELVTSASSAGQRPLYFDGLEQSIDVSRGNRWSVILNETKGKSGVVRVRLYESGNRTVPIAQKDVAISARGRISLDTVFASMDLDTAARRKDRANVLCVVTAKNGEASVSALALAVDPASGDAKTYAFKPSGGLPSSGVSLVTVAPPPPASRRRPAPHP